MQNNPRIRRKYDADFKAKGLKMLVNGQMVTYIPQWLGISENVICPWNNKHQVGKNLVFQAELAHENH